VVGPTRVGLVLAAGAGLRLRHDAPKPLVTDAAGVTWLERSVAALRDGGADEVYVVVGADATAVEAAVPPGCRTVSAPEWAEGMGASLRAGLTAVERDCPRADAVVVMLVDTPGVSAAVVSRLTARATSEALARAAYDGVPGHPVVLGRGHWRGVIAVAAGDRGARDYLSAAEVELVECGDVGSGEDIDTPDALGEWSRRSGQGRAPARPPRSG
jgi:CTP:molybdopterin cytidylyltransferase MocA